MPHVLRYRTVMLIPMGFSKRFSFSLLVGLIIALAVAPSTRAYKEVAPPAKVELPAAKSPTESLAAIRVPAGFEVQLVAAEPLVKDPIEIGRAHV